MTDDIEAKLPLDQEGEGKMPVIVCPHCKRGSDFAIKGETIKETDPKIVCAIGFCRLCKGAVWFELNNNNRESVVTSYPREVIADPEDLSPAVSRAFTEALYCASASAPNGALCMCRRAIQDALAELGAPPKGNLPSQLQALVDAQKITPVLKDWADQARIGGKLAAHGTGGDEWGAPEKDWGTIDDAKEVIEFCKSFFEYAFTMKKRLEKRKGNPPAS